MAIKHLTTDEQGNVKGLLPGDLFAQYLAIETYGERIDDRGPTEKELDHSYTPKTFTPAHKLYLSFDEEVRAEMERVKDDPLLIDEQRRAYLTKFIDEKAEEYVQKIGDAVAQHKTEVEEVREYLARAVPETDRLTPAEMREMEFVHREMSGEVQTAMYTAFDGSQVLAVFNKQLDLARTSKARARFLHKNGYLFMKRAEEVAGDKTESNRIITEIQKGLNRIEKHAYDPGHLVVKKMYENVKQMNRGGYGPARLVRSNQKAFKRSL